jgi:hypothetical protein
MSKSHLPRVLSRTVLLLSVLFPGWGCAGDNSNAGRARPDPMAGYSHQVREMERKQQMSREWHESNPGGRQPKR